MNRPQLHAFILRWELVWHLATVALLTSAVVVVVILFPGVSNLWVSIFVLTGSLTSSIAAAIAVLRDRARP